MTSATRLGAFYSLTLQGSSLTQLNFVFMNRNLSSFSDRFILSALLASLFQTTRWSNHPLGHEASSTDDVSRR